MRRLTLLTGAFFLALWAARLLTGGLEPASYLLRDGLLLAVVAAILFAGQSTPPRRLLPRGILYAWPTIGRVLWGAGITSALASAAVTTFLNSSTFSESLRLGLWLAGLLLIGVGAFWRGRVLSYATPAFRWRRADGSDERADGATLIRVPVSDGTPATQPPAKHLSGLSRGFGLWVGVGSMLMVGAFLRLWQLGSSPPSCVDNECLDALRLTQADQSTFGVAILDPFFAVARMLMPLTGDAVLSLRLAAALFGITSLLLIFLALKQLVSVESAFLGAWLLALSPWHIGLGRISSPETAVVFFITLSLGTLLHALASRDRRWWVAAGLALSAVTIAGPGLAPAIALWAVGVGVIACVRQRRFYASALLLAATAIAVSLTPFFQQTDGSTDIFHARSARLILDTLLERMGRLGDLSMINRLTMALALLGLGAMVRYAMRASMAVLLGGLLPLALLLTMQIDPPQQPMASWLLPLLPFAIVAATLAADQMLAGLVEIWRPLVRPAYFVTAAFLLVALTGAAGVGALWADLNGDMAAANDPPDSAMLTYLETEMDDGAIIYVPPTLFDSPALQLQGAGWLDEGRVLPLSSIEDALFSQGGSAGQRFLIRGDDRALLDLLLAYFPRSTAKPHFDEEAGRLLFYVLVPNAEDRLWPGLIGSYFRGTNLGDTTQTELLMDRRDGPLTFDWSGSFSPQPPFVVEWQGSLRVPASGRYRFVVDGVDVGAGTQETQEEYERMDSALFTLLLDNQVVLDSSLGVLEMDELLAEGVYQISMRYESGDTLTPLSIRWQRSDDINEVIPQSLLVTRILPDLGLIGSYYQGGAFQPPAQRLRKDLRFDQPPDFPDGYSVRWTGKLAANRAGEYLLATLADGYSRLSIDGRLLVEHVQTGGAASESSESPTDYAEGLIYLEEGWHTIQVDFSPSTESSTLQLLWQSPGSFPGLLSSVYLRPVSADSELADLSMPPAPALTDSRLGTDDFALSQGMAMRQPAVVLPPQNLPPLALEQLWSVGGGCRGDAGQLNGPHGVVIDTDGSRIFVADSGNQRIAVFGLNGDALPPIISDQFEEPHDVDIEPGGKLIVLDSVASPLHRVDLETAEVVTLSIDASFYRPRGLSVSSTGELYVADTGGGRVVLLTPDGKTLASYGGAESAMGSGQPVDAIATDRALWTITAEDGRLWDLNTDGSMVAVERTSTLDGPQLADLEDGTFFLSDPARQTIFYHRADGRPMAQFAYAGVLQRPTGIDAVVIDEQIHLVVVDTDQCEVSLWKALF